MRILLVEDDPHIGDGIAAGLKKLGMAVDWFSDGAQGQSAPLAAPYDAAVLDLGLPNIDGIEILRHWRKQGLTLPVLILTARDALPDRLTFGSLYLDTSAQTATLGGKPLNLTAREWRLLEMLVANPKHIISRAHIEDKLYGWDQEVESNAVEVHIHNLRKKIGSSVIQTKRGLGYQLGEMP